MATITYSCDTCKRKIELLENTQGLTAFSKCVITLGCKGKLSVIARNPDNYREVLPDQKLTLLDYVPRNALYKFQQRTKVKVWKIKHELGVYPVVIVYIENDDGSFTDLPPSDFTVTIVDKNNITVEFSDARKGIAHCLSRSSTTSSPTLIASDADVEDSQITAFSQFTFAIPKLITSKDVDGVITAITPVDLEAAEIQIEVEIVVPNQETFYSIETIGTTISSNNPWNSWPEILLRKRKNYYVRSKKITDFTIFGSNLKNIKNGTLLKFNQINYGLGWTEMPSRGLLMLLSNYPHNQIDKVKNKIINVSEVSGSANPYFTYKDGEFYAPPSFIENTSPEIMKA
jgi:hypothetical protein